MQPYLQWKSSKYYTYSENVFLAVDIQHAMHMHRIVICGLSASTNFFHISEMAQFIKKKKLLNMNCVFEPASKTAQDAQGTVLTTWYSAC